MSVRRLLAACALVALLALAAAVTLQHALDMQPCAWCVLQRLLLLLLLLATASGALTRGRAGALASSAGGFLLAVAGLWAALYQHLVAARTDACGLSLAERIIMAGRLHEFAPWMFMPTARCDEANAPLLGVPFALWSATLFAASALVCAAAAAALLRARPGTRP
jgi:disulfide bond formation protein DsbB